MRSVAFCFAVAFTSVAAAGRGLSFSYFTGNTIGAAAAEASMLASAGPAALASSAVTVFSFTASSWGAGAVLCFSMTVATGCSTFTFLRKLYLASLHELKVRIPTVIQRQSIVRFFIIRFWEGEKQSLYHIPGSSVNTGVSADLYCLMSNLWERKKFPKMYHGNIKCLVQARLQYAVSSAGCSSS